MSIIKSFVRTIWSNVFRLPFMAKVFFSSTRVVDRCVSKDYMNFRWWRFSMFQVVGEKIKKKSSHTKAHNITISPSHKSLFQTTSTCSPLTRNSLQLRHQTTKGSHHPNEPSGRQHMSALHPQVRTSTIHQWGSPLPSPSRTVDSDTTCWGKNRRKPNYTKAHNISPSEYPS